MKSLLLSVILLSTASIASAAERIMTCGKWTYKLNAVTKDAITKALTCPSKAVFYCQLMPIICQSSGQKTLWRPR